MTYLDKTRLNNTVFQFDFEPFQRGYFTDQYFENVAVVLQGLAGEAFRLHESSRVQAMPSEGMDIGNVVVEAQIFNRRAPYSVIAGVDAALTLLKNATGYFQDGVFVNTAHQLEVEAVYDGVAIPYDGHPENVLPVIKIRGRYRDFAMLETPILGILSHASRVATNVYHLLEVVNGKPISFFPARFDMPEVQAVDGYAYWLAVQRYNAEFSQQLRPSVSTDAQGAWWGGKGSGTVPHALIASFLGDTAEAMVAFARFSAPEIPRIVLADFNNDVIGDALKTLNRFWVEYVQCLKNGDAEGQRRWVLYAVRIDTSPNVRDKSLGEGDPYGVNPKLIRMLRQALDEAWKQWRIPAELMEVAMAYCHNVKIAVTGGFNRERISQYEQEQVPVDLYGVGSSLLKNDSDTNTDFTMDVVRVKVGETFYPFAKVGRRANENPDLHPVRLDE